MILWKELDFLRIGASGPMFSKDAARPWENITARRLIRQIQTNPSLMCSAAPESEIVVLIACKTTKTHAPAKTPAGEQGLTTGQRDPQTGLERPAQSASHTEGSGTRERTGLDPIPSPSPWP